MEAAEQAAAVASVGLVALAPPVMHPHQTAVPVVMVRRAALVVTAALRGSVASRAQQVWTATAGPAVTAVMAIHPSWQAYLAATGALVAMAVQ